MGILCAKRTELSYELECTHARIFFIFFFVVIQREEVDYTCANLVARENMRVIKTVAEVPESDPQLTKAPTVAPFGFRLSVQLAPCLSIFQFSRASTSLTRWRWKFEFMACYRLLALCAFTGTHKFNLYTTHAYVCITLNTYLHIFVF